MSAENNGIFGEEPRKVSITLRELLSGYVMRWPLFLICTLVCVVAAILYTRYTTPEYMAVTSYLIKGSEGGNSGNSNDLIQVALNGKREVDLNNEILVVSSARLMQRTVARNGFNITYIKKGRMLDIDIYNAAPFTLIAKQLSDSNRDYNLNIKKFNKAGGIFLYGAGKEEKTYSFRWNEPFTISGQSFVLAPKNTMQSAGGEIIVRWQPVALVAARLSKELTAKAIDAKTSVIQLSLRTENFEKGKDVLNALFSEYNLSDIEERNEISENTVRFIEDRLLAISGDLKGVEGNLEDYQNSKQLVDIKGQTGQSLSNANEVSRTIKNLAIEQSVAAMISEYFAHPAKGSKLVPSSLGLSDGTLSSLITLYNELQLKKEREAPMVAPNSTVMQDLDTQLANLKSSILESLNNIGKNLRLQDNNFQEQNSQYRNFLSSVPHNERGLQEIMRKQRITEGLYMYLLQKREETAISGTSSNVSNYMQIDLATGYGPVWPNSKNIIIYSALFGFAIAFGWIYFRNLLYDKVKSREDIIKRTSLSLLGEISHMPGRKKKVISVLSRNIIGEQFRAIRTNLYFLLKDKAKKVILVTSSGSAEGKSFISLNLAAVYAMSGNKVALLEFDTRKPVIGNNLHLDNTKGLTDYLIGDVNSLSEIRKGLDEIPGLDIYLSGPVPTNPADLLMTANMSRLFETFRAEYDYIIVDSPPAGLVTDAFILGEYSDMVLYIVRNQKTLKKQLDFIDEIVSNQTLINVALILNDIKKIDNYRYGYGSDYAYYGGSKRSKQKKKVVKPV